MRWYCGDLVEDKSDYSDDEWDCIRMMDEDHYYDWSQVIPKHLSKKRKHKTHWYDYEY